MTNEQFIKLKWMHRSGVSIHLLHEGSKSAVDLIPGLFFTSLMTT